VPVAATVAFSILPYATMSTCFNALFVAGRTRIMAVAAPVAAALNLVLNLLLLPVIGLVGASIATVIGYGALAGIIAVGSRRVAELPQVLSAALTTWPGRARGRRRRAAPAESGRRRPCGSCWR